MFSSPRATRPAMTQMTVLTTLPRTFWRAPIRAEARAVSGPAPPTTDFWLTRPIAPSSALVASRRAVRRIRRRANRVATQATSRMRAMRRGTSTIQLATSANAALPVQS